MKQGESHNFPYRKLHQTFSCGLEASKVRDNATADSCYGSKYKPYMDIPVII